MNQTTYNPKELAHFFYETRKTKDSKHHKRIDFLLKYLDQQNKDYLNLYKKELEEIERLENKKRFPTQTRYKEKTPTELEQLEYNRLRKKENNELNRQMELEGITKKRGRPRKHTDEEKKELHKLYNKLRNRKKREEKIKNGTMKKRGRPKKVVEA